MTNAATLTYACDPQNASCGGHKCASSHKVNAPFAPREATMLSGFKQFILRGNVVDMAVGVVVGAAFATVVSAFTKDLLTPLIARPSLVSPISQQLLSPSITANFCSAISLMRQSRSCWSPQRSTFLWCLWCRSRVRWNRENLLGGRRHGHVRGGSECLGSGRAMPPSRQTGKVIMAFQESNTPRLGGSGYFNNRWQGQTDLTNSNRNTSRTFTGLSTAASWVWLWPHRFRCCTPAIVQTVGRAEAFLSLETSTPTFLSLRTLFRTRTLRAVSESPTSEDLWTQSSVRPRATQRAKATRSLRVAFVILFVLVIFFSAIVLFLLFVVRLFSN